MIAAIGRGIQKDFGKKHRRKSLMSLQGSQQPHNNLLNIIYISDVYIWCYFLPSLVPALLH